MLHLVVGLADGLVPVNIELSHSSLLLRLFTAASARAVSSPSIHRRKLPGRMLERYFAVLHSLLLSPKKNGGAGRKSFSTEPLLERKADACQQDLVVVGHRLTLALQKLEVAVGLVSDV